MFSLSSPKLRSRAVNDGTIITPYANRKDVGLTCKKCAATFVPSGPPFIVPPTWNKTAASNVIQNVWRSAAHHLREARHIVVVGYSFPPTDEYFKLLLGLGMASGAPIDTFAIVDPNADAIAARIRKFLGPALDRSLRSVPLPFAQGLVEILPQILAPKWRDGAREEIKKRARIMQRGEYPTD